DLGAQAQRLLGQARGIPPGDQGDRGELARRGGVQQRHGAAPDRAGAAQDADALRSPAHRHSGTP
ncbi:hypothetical protein HMPREF0731_3735, partial [Pseudoroseomonas cervicalis ATCC 49957]